MNIIITNADRHAYVVVMRVQNTMRDVIKSWPAYINAIVDTIYVEINDDESVAISFPQTVTEMFESFTL